MNKLNIAALSIFLLAFVVAIGTPIYSNIEHKKALERQSEWIAEAEKVKRLPPSLGCIHGHYRVTDFSGAMPVSLPVWSNEGVVECGNGYSINGKAIKEDEAKRLSYLAISRHRMSDRKDSLKNNTGSASIDPTFMLQMAKTALKNKNISDSEKANINSLIKDLMGE